MSALLPPGSRVGVVFPSHPVRSERRWQDGLRILREEGGLEPVVLAGFDLHHRVHAGTDEHRRSALVEALTDEQLDGVWLGRGGSGLTRLLPGLPFERFARTRPVLGFSDATALFLGMDAARRGIAVHAPVVHSLSQTAASDRRVLFAQLGGAAPTPLTGTSWVDGDTGETTIVAGNLALFASTCGTPWQLRPDGAILLLEDIGEPPYRIDRMVVQLRDSGILGACSGVALGQFTGCQAPADVGWTLQELLMDHLEPLGVPVLADLPVGHADRNLPIIWRAPARIVDSQLHLSASPGVVSLRPDADQLV